MKLGHADTLAELRHIIESFYDRCPITPVDVFYQSDPNGCGSLRLSTERGPALRDSKTFRYCVLFLRNAGERIRAIHLVVATTGMPVVNL